MHPALTVTFAVAAGLVALAGVWSKIIHPAWRKLRVAWAALEDFMQDWNGHPGEPARPGRPAVPERLGVLARLDHQRDTLRTHGEEQARQSAALAQIRHEVLPNNGGSLRDRVDMLATHVDDLTDTLATHIRHSDAERAYLLGALQTYHPDVPPLEPPPDPEDDGSGHEPKE